MFRIHTLQQVRIGDNCASLPPTAVETTNLKWSATKQYCAAAQWSMTGWADVTNNASYTWSRAGGATGATVANGLYTAGKTPGTDNVLIQHNTLGVGDNTSVTVENFSLKISGTAGGAELA